MSTNSRKTTTPRLSGQRLNAIVRKLEGDVGTCVIPGAMIVVGTRDGVQFERAIGFRDATTGDPLRADAIWRIYSMTKPLVTAAAMIFVEQGLLRLDQPVADFIPSFGKLRVIDVERSDNPANNPPTIQDLMRH